MDNNIKNEIIEVIKNVPKNISPIEKVRWVYIKLGHIISFDLKTFDSSKKLDLDSDYVDRYQTCVQVSYLLNDILNQIDPNIKCEVIERKLQRKSHEQEHLANVVTVLNDGFEEKYLLDLTLDLFRIHFDAKTMEFGYCEYGNITLDIMPQSINAQMDKKLGLYKDGYIEDKLQEVKTELSFIDFSNLTFEEEMDYRLLRAKPFLDMNKTYPETTEFLFRYIIDYMLCCHTIRGIIRKDNSLKNVYIYEKSGQYVIYILDDENRFYKSSVEEIQYLLENGWINNKGIINDYLTQSVKKL